MISPGDVISYMEMCQEEGATLQRGMNFRFKGGTSVILMSLRRGAPYEDRIESNGRVLIYEGHDLPRTINGPDPKSADQPSHLRNGKPTQNSLFFEAATRAERGDMSPELVKVYEKIHNGVWAFDGVFKLVGAREEVSNERRVFKFKLELTDDQSIAETGPDKDLPHNRLIPSSVKLEVWKRDGGKCVLCGKRENLHFDHDIPYSRGGSSLIAKNIRLLCAKHNLQKHDKIE